MLALANVQEYYIIGLLTNSRNSAPKIGLFGSEFAAPLCLTALPGIEESGYLAFDTGFLHVVPDSQKSMKMAIIRP